MCFPVLFLRFFGMEAAPESESLTAGVVGVSAENSQLLWGRADASNDGQLDAALDDAGADGIACQSGRVVNVELLHQMLAMLLDCLDADAQFRSNRRVTFDRRRGELVGSLSALPGFCLGTTRKTNWLNLTHTTRSRLESQVGRRMHTPITPRSSAISSCEGSAGVRVTLDPLEVSPLSRRSTADQWRKEKAEMRQAETRTGSEGGTADGRGFLKLKSRKRRVRGGRAIGRRDWASLRSGFDRVIADRLPAGNEVPFLRAASSLPSGTIMGMEMGGAVRHGVNQRHVPLQPLVQIPGGRNVDGNPTPVLFLPGINVIARQRFETRV